MEKFYPILIVDNEYENISDLQEVLDRAVSKKFQGVREPTIYVESAEEALEAMIDAMNSGNSFSSIISDNHLYGEIDGEDFFRMLNGHLAYNITKETRHLGMSLDKFSDFDSIFRFFKKPHNKMRYFLGNNFSDLDEYRRFFNYFSNQDNGPFKILFCGHPNEVDNTGIEEVPIIQKSPDEDNLKASEYKVLDRLIEAGALEKEIVNEAVNRHYRLSTLNGNGRTYNPSSHHIKVRKKKVLGKKIN